MKVLIIMSLVILVSACKAGNGEGLTDQGRPNDEIVTNENEEGSGSDVIQPTLTSIQENIFTPICASCHGGASPAAGQDLSSIESSIANLVNVESSNPLYKRVLPSSSLESYLYLKVAGDSKAGARMPLGQPALDEMSIQAIKQWIDDGALIPENLTTPVRVNKVTVKVKSINESKAMKTDYIWREKGDLVIVISFNKAMNFSTLTSEQILVTAYNSTTLIGDYDYYLSTDDITLNIVNNHTLQLSMGDLEPDIKQLKIRLNQSSISTLTTGVGQELDGDNDGIDGGVFNYDITF